jgi:hypothetical protein
MSIVDDKDLENLVRMAAEIDALEQAARVAAPESDAAPVRIRFDRPRDRRPFWRLGASTAAAAAVLLLVLLPLSSARHSRFEIAYCPSVPRFDGVRIDRFEPSSPQQCVVLAIFHTWQTDCQCLAWQLYEWEDGRPLAEFTPEQVHDITIDVTDAPPLEQLLLVAIAKNPRDLPSNEADTSDLLDCLNELAPPTDPHGSATSYASAVRACLPDTVKVVPRSFFVE